MTPGEPAQTFDELANDYEAVLDAGLAVSGEGSDYFAERRVVWLAEKLRTFAARPKRALDFGCGTGSSTPHLLRHLDLELLRGVDVSPRSIEVCRSRHGSERAEFMTLDRHEPDGTYDLAFCNGVFHHIRPSERARAVEHIYRSLRPGGFWAFWDNNPFNPGTQWIMWRLPFDRDAIKLFAREARAVASTSPFEVLATDHLFVFPRFLRALRPLERRLAHLPLGAQYLVLCRKPDVDKR